MGKAWDTDRAVWGKGKLWQHSLTLQAPKDSDLARRWKKGKPELPRAKHLVKVYVDQKSQLAKDWQATLGADDFVGQVELESAWLDGYDRMTAVDAAKTQKR